MVYQWKIPTLYSVDAQTAGEELERIYNERGELSPKNVVDASRSEQAPLHVCFEWDNEKAAEKWREEQASRIISTITIVGENANTAGREVRAFIHAQGSYHPLAVVVSDVDKTAEMLQNALKELSAFRKKYETLSQLAPLFDAMGRLTA